MPWCRTARADRGCRSAAPPSVYAEKRARELIGGFARQNAAVGSREQRLPRGTRWHRRNRPRRRTGPRVAAAKTLAREPNPASSSQHSQATCEESHCDDRARCIDFRRCDRAASPAECTAIFGPS
jgi:hypothetical protein